MTDDLLATIIEAAGGQKLWNMLRGLTIDLSVGGPMWAMKGWPPGATFDQTVTADTAAFKGHLRPTPWDALHLGYFLGYANWNYFTSPFLFRFPGIVAEEIEPWHEAGQTWRRLRVRFRPSIATHGHPPTDFSAQPRQHRQSQPAVHHAGRRQCRAA